MKLGLREWVEQRPRPYWLGHVEGVLLGMVIGWVFGAFVLDASAGPLLIVSILLILVFAEVALGGWKELEDQPPPADASPRSLRPAASKALVLAILAIFAAAILTILWLDFYGQI